MHADLTDASVHVPVDVLNPPELRQEPGSQPAGTEEGPDPADDTAAVRMPTYDEIAERALELYGRPPDMVARALAEWVSAEGQRRLLRTQDGP